MAQTVPMANVSFDFVFEVGCDMPQHMAEGALALDSGDKLGPC